MFTTLDRKTLKIKDSVKYVYYPRYVQHPNVFQI